MFMRKCGLAFALLLLALLAQACAAAELTVEPLSGQAMPEIGDGCIVIREGGAYQIGGEAEDCQIVVELEKKKEEAILILNSARIACEGKAAILALRGKLHLMLAGENAISGGGEGQSAAIYAKDDVILSGDGRLSVAGTDKHGIESRDELRILSGEIDVRAERDALRGREKLRIEGGAISCTAGSDGLRVNGDDEEKLGRIEIRGGSLRIEAQSDAIGAKGSVEISGGDVAVLSCNEGIEAHYIEISGGSVSIHAVDDGLNASGDESARIEIHGGSLHVEAQGDGIDSNGRLVLTGGEIVIHGTTSPRNSPLDYTGSCETGEAVVIACGSASMAQAPKASEGRSTLRLYFDGMQCKEQLVSVRDEAGKTLLSVRPGKDYQVVILSHPALRAGERVTLTRGGESDFGPESYAAGRETTGDEPLCTIELLEGLTSVNEHGEARDWADSSLGW